MLQLIIKRIFNSAILIIFVTFFTFMIMRISGDPLADLKLNPAVSEATIAAETKRLGLDKSFHEQYLIWVTNILKGDLGYSQSNQKVVNVIKPALLNTLLLNVLAILCTWLISIPLGVMAAVKRNSVLDITLRIFTSCLMSMPSFVMAIFMLLFALYTGWLPIGGLTSSFFDELSPIGKIIDLSRHLVLPVFILTLLGLSDLQRQMRGNLLDVLREDYIRTARAKGLSETVVIFKHALRNAINPLITILGYEFSNLFAGSALVEMVLAYPGLGYLTLEAARKLDINVVLANLLLGSLMLVLGNLLADLLLMKVDPKIRN